MRQVFLMVLIALLSCSILQAQQTQPAQDAALLKAVADIRAQKWNSKKEMYEALAALIKPGMTFTQAKLVLPPWSPPPTTGPGLEVTVGGKLMHLDNSYTGEIWISGPLVMIYPIDADFNVGLFPLVSKDLNTMDQSHCIVDHAPVITARAQLGVGRPAASGPGTP